MGHGPGAVSVGSGRVAVWPCGLENLLSLGRAGSGREGSPPVPGLAWSVVPPLARSPGGGGKFVVPCRAGLA